MPMKVRYSTIDGEIIAEKRNGVRRTYVPDPLGSTRALLDNQQQITDRFDYWPYGAERDHGGTLPIRLRFVGTRGFQRDLDSRYYVHTRTYLSLRSRFVSAERSGKSTAQYFASLGENSYIYARNNPGSAKPPRDKPKSPGPFPGDYGFYCGRARDPFGTVKPPFAFPKPWDELDACCRKHDLAYSIHKCTPKLDLRQECRAADLAFCLCVQSADCAKSTTPKECFDNRWKIKTFACDCPRLGPRPP